MATDFISSIYGPMIWGASGYSTLLQTTGINLGTSTTAPRIRTSAPSAVSGTSIDFNLSEAFTKTSTGNHTFTFSNVRAGDWMLFRLKNGASHTATWPTSVKWPSAAAPVLTLVSKTDLYFFWAESASIIYGFYVQNYT